ncbi:carbohydrate ABC transporter permease [Dielma fastidiosa]|uniref:Sugar ABC transporter permease n=1 Tax=Dielma fastidiosa TaxID=1034346 RepID=A0AB35UX67_9FIRM|nr:sugar ABC transporter permease [Dielma fastidiosa]MDY5169765.1 sugar ABC transporter permease [Dielma fastidiosa]
MNKRRAKRRFIIGCLTPAIILVTIFMIIPTINVFYMSLFKWGGLSNNKKFIGFENFQKLFNDTNFLRAMQNTILLVVVVTIITLFFAIIFASILSREKIKGQNFFRIVFYIPNILSVVVIAAIFGAIYNPTTGLLNSLFDMLSLPNLKQMWMGNSNIALYSLAAALVWQAIGYYMVMYMASMSSIPENLYEAASLEGAGRMKQFFLVTLPLVWDNIRTTLTFFIISTINLSFLFVKIMTGGGPNGATEVFLSYMYNQAYTNSSYGYGMAIGVIVFIFSFILSGIVNKVTERDVLEF